VCLAVPGKVVKIDGNRAMVEYDEVKKWVDISLLEKVNVGDYILVHAGYGIEIVNVDEAIKTLELYKEILDV